VVVVEGEEYACGMGSGGERREAYFVLDCLVAPDGGHVLRHFGGWGGGGRACRGRV
jgi:hypothetical protein